jgi:tetratricopeptide (TPR) repeat protein
VLAIVSVVVIAFAALTARQVSYWHDSVSLWSRAVAVNPQNDIATYNLAAAFADLGRTDDAIGWYQQTLRLVPDHAQAMKNVDALLADRFEDQAVRSASEGQLQVAIEAYTNVLRLDPSRRQARAGRGIALARTEDWTDAASDLATARSDGDLDPEVANSLAQALVHLERSGEAVAVLKDAIRTAPEEVSLAHNLARLLLDAADPSVRDPRLAQRLAEEICNRTGNRDPQALETLAVAYAANGRRDLALPVAVRGANLARGAGDRGTADALEALIRRLQN